MLFYGVKVKKIFFVDVVWGGEEEITPELPEIRH